MIRIFLALLLFFSSSISIGHAEGTGFPTRSVVVLNTHDKARSGDHYPLTYIKNSIIEVFKFPYYEIKSGEYPGIQPSAEYLTQIAEESGADLVIAPVLEIWEYDTYLGYHSFFKFDEHYIRADVRISLYTYNRELHKLTKNTKQFRQINDSLSMPSREEILRNLMTDLLSSLPYKRIPTDVPRYSNSVTMPTMTQQVKSPYPLPPSIHQL